MRAKADDRDTSEMAAASIDEVEGIGQVRPGRGCHKVLYSYGEYYELTDDEAAFYAILREGEGRIDSLRRRSSDLLAYGLIEDTGVTRRSLNGGGVRHEHRITEEGRRALGILAEGRTWIR